MDDSMDSTDSNGTATPKAEMDGPTNMSNLEGIPYAPLYRGILNDYPVRDRPDTRLPAGLKHLTATVWDDNAMHHRRDFAIHELSSQLKHQLEPWYMQNVFIPCRRQYLQFVLCEIMQLICKTDPEHYFSRKKRGELNTVAVEFLVCCHRMESSFINLWNELLSRCENSILRYRKWAEEDWAHPTKHAVTPLECIRDNIIDKHGDHGEDEMSLHSKYSRSRFSVLKVLSQVSQKFCDYGVDSIDNKIRADSVDEKIQALVNEAREYQPIWISFQAAKASDPDELPEMPRIPLLPVEDFRSFLTPGDIEETQPMFETNSLLWLKDMEQVAELLSKHQWEDTPAPEFWERAAFIDGSSTEGSDDEDHEASLNHTRQTDQMI
jgi:hypothetical protein